jgi:hypothetical protein
VSAGYIYAFWHPQAPNGVGDTKRIKIGRSKRYPWGDTHEHRGEKLAFAFRTLGFSDPCNVFKPISVPDMYAAERKLKAELKVYAAANCGRSIEAYDVPIEIFEALKFRTSI